jgi:hypothetical protein
VFPNRGSHGVHNSDLAIRYLHHAIDRIQTDRCLPIVVSTGMLSFFIDLETRSVPQLNELGAFLAALPPGALEESLLEQATPIERRHLLLAMRLRHKALQNQLENEIRRKCFANAAAFRNQQNDIIQTIRTTLSGTQLQMTPPIVANALQSLGWQHN